MSLFTLNHRHVKTVSLPVMALLLALPLSAQAKNTPPTHYTFNDSETVPVILSSVDINRLVVKDDKITAIDCPEGFCVVTGTKSDNSGAARVNLNLAVPFTAYVSTQKGRHFGLFITPKARPAVTSIFTPEFLREQTPSLFDKQAPYTTLMSEFVAAMMRYHATGEPIKGYQVHSIDNTQANLEKAVKQQMVKGMGAAYQPNAPVKVKPTGLTSEPAIAFTGKHFGGIIYRLTNHSNAAMTLTTAQFYTPTMRAAALSTHKLLSQQVGYLFVVSGGDMPVLHTASRGE